MAAEASPQPDNRPPATGLSDVHRALVLQGGGALGAYQAGVYEGLLAREPALDWVAGVSIGAINAALIAGNPPEQRVARLREFWQLVSSAPGQQWPHWAGDRRWLNHLSAGAAVASGIPGFFEPRLTPALMLGATAPVLSYYDTTPLKATLERLVDFDRINDGPMRFSVGAVNVRTGNSVYFDNRHQRIGAEHIMASGALPPAFAPVHIDGEDFWDGGIVSNTPLQYVLDEHPRTSRLLVLQVDLFNARGPLPRTLGEVMARQKDIQYSSRTRMNTDTLTSSLNLQEQLAELLKSLPKAQLDNPLVAMLCAQLEHAPVDVMQLIYRQKSYELDSKDYEFSRISVQEHWEAGLHDVDHSFTHREWLRRVSHGAGVTTWDLGEPDAPRVRHPRPAAQGRKQERKQAGE